MLTCPEILTLDSAHAFGRAASKVCGYRYLWDQFTVDHEWKTNCFHQLMQNYWNEIFTPDEKAEIITEFVKERLK